MKILFLSLCLVCCGAIPAYAQSAEALTYAPRPVALVGNEGTENVVLMRVVINGNPTLQFVPASKVAETLKNGGLPIRYGDVLSVLGQAAQSIQNLQAQNAALRAENERLWKLAMKDNPRQVQPPAPTVIVQQPASPPPSRLERYMLLRGLMSQPSQNQNIHVTVSNCTRFPALCAGR